MKKYFAAFDLGTSSIKATLIEAHDGVVYSCTSDYPLITDVSGKAEQDASLWWKAFCITASELAAHLENGMIEAVCVSGQMMVCLPLDANGRPLRNAMTWADGRAVAEHDEFAGSIAGRSLYSVTGMHSSANYTLPKILYLKNHEPEIYQKAKWYISAKDYIDFLLTGAVATDPEDASFTLGLGLNDRDWTEELLAAAGLEYSQMPCIRPVGTVLGGVSRKASAECGIPEGTPVVLGTGDGGAATLGSGAVKTGDAYTSLGTSSWVCVITNSPTPDPRQAVNKIRYLNGYRDSGTMQAGGYSYSWLKDLLGCSYEQLTERTLREKPGAGGLLFLPQLMGERAPFWDSELRGAFVGLKSSMNAGHLGRAVTDGVAMQLGLILTQITDANRCTVDEMSLVGGGANSPLWVQTLADAYGIPVVTTDSAQHAGALGIAVIAGTAVGVFGGYEDIELFRGNKTVAMPDPKTHTLYQKLTEIFIMTREKINETDHIMNRLIKENIL